LKGVGPLRQKCNDQNQGFSVSHGIPRVSFNRQPDPLAVIGMSKPSPRSMWSMRNRLSGVVWRPASCRQPFYPGLKNPGLGAIIMSGTPMRIPPQAWNGLTIYQP